MPMQESSNEPDAVDSGRDKSSSKSGRNNKIEKNNKENRKMYMGEDPRSKET